MARVVMLGNFSLYNKGTMRARAFPLARALVRRGHSVALVLPALDQPAAGGEVRLVDGVTVRHLPVVGPIGIRHALTLFDLSRAALTGNADVVHLFKPVSWAGAVATLSYALSAVGLRRTPLVVDTDDWEGAGGWVDLDRRPAWLKWLVDRQERWVLRHCSAVTVASLRLASMVRALGVPEAAVHYVPNGVDGSAGGRVGRLRSAARAGLGLNGERVVLLYTRFFEFDLSQVVSTVQAVTRLIPNAKLLVVGRGFHQEERRMGQLLHNAGLGEAALFVGWAEADDLPGYFAAADVAIYPFADNLVNRTKCPAKLVELLAAGLPVVANDVGQIGEYIVHRRSGMLVSPGDDQGIATAVVEILRNPELARSLGDAAAARMRGEFHWDGLAQRAERAYGLAPAEESAGSRSVV